MIHQKNLKRDSFLFSSSSSGWLVVVAASRCALSMMDGWRWIVSLILIFHHRFHHIFFRFSCLFSHQSALLYILWNVLFHEVEKIKNPLGMNECEKVMKSSPSSASHRSRFSHFVCFLFWRAAHIFQFILNVHLNSSSRATTSYFH